MEYAISCGYPLTGVHACAIVALTFESQCTVYTYHNIYIYIYIYTCTGYISTYSYYVHHRVNVCVCVAAQQLVRFHPWQRGRA